MLQNTLVACFVIWSFNKATISLSLSSYILVFRGSFKMDHSWHVNSAGVKIVWLYRLCHKLVYNLLVSVEYKIYRLVMISH
jgi:hypothetical protein